MTLSQYSENPGKPIRVNPIFWIAFLDMGPEDGYDFLLFPLSFLKGRDEIRRNHNNNNTIPKQETNVPHSRSCRLPYNIIRDRVKDLGKAAPLLQWRVEMFLRETFQV